MHSLLCRVLLGTAVTLAISLRWSAADAQPAPSTSAPVSASARAAAKKLTDDAIAAEGAKDYATAIALYRQAYQLVPHPLLQFNIGQAYMLAGNRSEAEKFFRRYLARDPDGPGAPTARKFLASIPASPPHSSKAERPTPTQPTSSSSGGKTGTVSSETAGPAKDTTPPAARVQLAANARASRPEQIEPDRAVSAVDGNEFQQVTDGDAPKALSDDLDVETRRQHATNTKIFGGVFIGSGVVLASAAVAMAMDGRDNLGLGMGVIGLGLFVGGIASYKYGERQLRAADSVAWSPVIGSGFAGFVLTGALP